MFLILMSFGEFLIECILEFLFLSHVSVKLYQVLSFKLCLNELPRRSVLNLKIDQSVTRFSSVRDTNKAHTCPKIRNDPWNFEFKTKLDQF